MVAEGVGFEPTVPVSRNNGFQDRHHKPLGHPSVLSALVIPWLCALIQKHY